jgi:hypothetical protein
MDNSHTSPQTEVLFAINMLVSKEGGVTYTFDEFHYALTFAGFSEIALMHNVEATNSLIRAAKTSEFRIS